MEGKKSNSLTKYQKQFKGGDKGQKGISAARGRELNNEKARARLEGDKIDLMFGFDRFVEVT
jgi:hypothetical protein